MNAAKKWAADQPAEDGQMLKMEVRQPGTTSTPKLDQWVPPENKAIRNSIVELTQSTNASIREERRPENGATAQLEGITKSIEKHVLVAKYGGIHIRQNTKRANM